MSYFVCRKLFKIEKRKKRKRKEKILPANAGRQNKKQKL